VIISRWIISKAHAFANAPMWRLLRNANGPILTDFRAPAWIVFLYNNAIMVHRIFIASLLLCALATAVVSSNAAHPVLAADAKPFGLPFAGPPGPATWLLIQSYGNTTGAYMQRRAWYAAGQGLHFGIDFSAPCGTTIVAIGDGVVVGTDGPWGSAPHNLMIDHQNGYVSMYGHLLERAKLQPGQKVKRGQPIALSGDPDGTCHSRPHLHLEIRSKNSARFYNPVQLIDADWDTLALTGGFGRGFERNLDNPRQWQTIYNQPEVTGGGPFLNDYAHPWPPAPVSR
jgi:Peptidase family M23